MLRTLYRGLLFAGRLFVGRLFVDGEGTTALGPAEQTYRVRPLARMYAVPREDSPVNVGFHTRSSGDDYPLAIDFSACDIFSGSGNAVTAAAVTSSPSGLTVTSSADVTTANVAKFNVSGGTSGVTYTVAVTAENAGGRKCRRELTVHTEG